MKTKPFSELRNQMTPERRAKNEARAKIASLYLTLMELQQSLGIAQEDLEKDFGVLLSNISELDDQEDIQVSVLGHYIKALGGSLKLVANFPEEEIVLARFE